MAIPTFARAIRVMSAVTVTGTLLVGAVACSRDRSSGEGASGSTTTGVGSKPTGSGASTPQDAAVTDVTPTTEAVRGETFSGKVGGDTGDDVEVGFVRTEAAMRNLAIRGLEVRCLPDSPTGKESTMKVDLIFPTVAVRSDGWVDFTDPKHPWQPAISGSFNKQGRFVGSLFLNRKVDGRTCGGDYPLDLAP